VAYANQLSETMLNDEVENLVQATYRWVLDQPGVSLALSGAKDLGEMVDPVKASDLTSFDDVVSGEVEEMHSQDFGAA
jgi:aryl-alcohol dehydrogenase-like predicted oxidoreductase